MLKDQKVPYSRIWKGTLLKDQKFPFPQDQESSKKFFNQEIFTRL